MVAAEFGRSPKITRSNSGREHWESCYSVILAGGGIRGGTVVGRSDKNAAYPAASPMTGADFTATIYDCLGIDPSSETHDQTGRPIMLSKGTQIAELAFLGPLGCIYLNDSQRAGSKASEFIIAHANCSDSPSTIRNVSTLTRTTWPTSRTMYSGSSARFGSERTPLRLSSLT